MNFFKRKHQPSEKTEILFVQCGSSFFRICEKSDGTHSILFCAGHLFKNSFYENAMEELLCPDIVVNEAFRLIKKHSVFDILDGVKRSEYRDIECYMGYTLAVRCNYADLQYEFCDTTGSCYEKSSDKDTQLCMLRLISELTELYFLVQQKKIA